MSGTCPQAFVQCPGYEWMKPDAYNYELSKEERARVLDDWEAGDMGRYRGDMGRSARRLGGPRHFAAQQAPPGAVRQRGCHRSARATLRASAPPACNQGRLAGPDTRPISHLLGEGKCRCESIAYAAKQRSLSDHTHSADSRPIFNAA